MNLIGSRSLVGFCLITSLVIAFVVPGNLLLSLGVPYSQPGGSYWLKFHPSTYFLTLSGLIALMESRTRNALFEACLRHRIHTLYLFMIVLMTSYALVSFGPSGVAFYIDTLLVPGLFMLFMLISSSELRQKIFVICMFFLTLHALIGIVEYLVQSRLIPFYLDGEIYEEVYFRSTGLSSHPLEGAGRALCALFAVWLIRGAWVPWLALLFFVSLFAFGSRSALGFGFLLLLLMGIRSTTSFFLSPKVNPLSVIFALLSLVLSTSVVFIALNLGFGERILDTLYVDSSALSRLKSLEILREVELDQLLRGVGAEGVIQLEHARRGWFTIENFWVVLVLQTGLVMAGLMSMVFLYFLYTLASSSQRPIKIMILAFLLAASGNNALTVKTQNLLILIALVAGGISVSSRHKTELPVTRKLAARLVLRHLRSDRLSWRGSP